MCSLILLLYCHLSLSCSHYSISQNLLCGVYPVPPHMWNENWNEFFKNIYLTGTFLYCTCLYLSCYYSKFHHEQIGLNMVSMNPQHPEKHNICVVDQKLKVTTNHTSTQPNAKTRARHSRIKNVFYPHTVNNVWSGLLYPSVLKTNQSIYHTFPPS